MSSKTKISKILREAVIDPRRGILHKAVYDMSDGEYFFKTARVEMEKIQATPMSHSERRKKLLGVIGLLSQSIAKMDEGKWHGVQAP